jgi:hypothetical protein
MKGKNSYLYTLQEYDMLCKIQDALNKGCSCILEALTGSEYTCKYTRHDGCKKCIAEFVNRKMC